MKKKLMRLFACMMLGVMLFSTVSGATNYDNGHYVIDCTLKFSSGKATGTTNGAQYYDKEYYNRVLVYTKKNGVTQKSAYKLKSGSMASATTSKASGVTRAESYHFIADSQGNSLEALYYQVKLSR